MDKSSFCFCCFWHAYIIQPETVTFLIKPKISAGFCPVSPFLVFFFSLIDKIFPCDSKRKLCFHLIVNRYLTKLSDFVVNRHG